MKKQSKLRVLLRMVKLVKPLTGFMVLAILMGSLGFLCAQFIPICALLNVHDCLLLACTSARGYYYTTCMRYMPCNLILLMVTERECDQSIGITSFANMRRNSLFIFLEIPC